MGLASGGVVTRPTLALIGEGGEDEYVIPASKMRGMRGGVAVTVNVNGGGDARAVASAAGQATFNAVFDALESSGPIAKRARHALSRRL